MLYTTVDMSYESHADIGTIVYRCTYVVISVLYVYVHFINSALPCVILVVAFGHRRFKRWQFFEEAAKFLYVTACHSVDMRARGGWGEKKRRRRREEKSKRREEEEKEEIGEGERKRREEEKKRRGGEEGRGKDQRMRITLLQNYQQHLPMQ